MNTALKIKEKKGEIRYKSVLSSSNADMKVDVDIFFPVSKGDEKDFVIVSEGKELKDIPFLDIKNGIGLIDLKVYVSKETLSELESSSKSALSAFVRSVVSKMNSYKGARIQDRTFYTASREEIKKVYDSGYEGFLSRKKFKEKMSLIKESQSYSGDSSLDDISTDATNDFSSLCRQSYKRGASDIHIILNEKAGTSRIENRILGEIEVVDDKMTYKKALEMVSAAYSSMADSTSRSHGSFNPSLRQDCRISLKISDEEEIALRYAGSPTGFGSNIVLRILITKVKNKKKQSINNIGLLDSQVKMLMSIARKPVGALIIAGVTGSGKSTTLRLLLEDERDRNPDKKIITIEQPIEYVIEDVVQISVVPEGPEDKNPAARCAESAMRQDPDTIMIGEVRNVESANLLASAQESGHQVLGTVHASSALEVVSRLTGKAMNLPLDTVASMNFISGLVYQKLVPILCEHCKKPYNQDDFKDRHDFNMRVQSIVDLEEHQVFTRNHNGCPKCNHRGVSGREICAEVINPDLKMRQFWLKGDFLSAFEHWRSTKDLKDDTNAQGKTALEIAIIKMKSGRICPNDIEKSFGDINEDFIMEDGVRSHSEVN